MLINSVEDVKQDFLIRSEIYNLELDNLGLKLINTIDKYRSREISNNIEQKQILENLLLDDKNISNHIFMNQKCKLYEQNFKYLSQFVNKDLLNLKLKDKRLVGIRQKPTRTLIGFLYGPVSTLFIDRALNLEPSISIVDLSCFLKSSCGLAEIYDGTKCCLALTDYAANDIKIMSKYDSYCLTDIDIISRDNFRLNKFKCYYAICSDSNSNRLIGLRDQNENLYACDMELHRVIIFDQNVTKIRRIINHVPGDENEEFECPRDICYHDGLFYVLDQGKCVINIFYKNGDFYKNFYFNKQEVIVKNPWSVRVGPNRIILIDWKEKVFIFDFDFNLINTIQIDSVLSMCTINDYDDQELVVFFHCENGSFSGYRINCNEAKFDLIFEKYFKELKYRSEFMLFTSTQHFVLSLGWNKSLAIVDFA